MVRRSFGIVVIGLLAFIFIAGVLAWTWKPSPRSNNTMDSEYEGTDRDDSTHLSEGEHRPCMDFQKPPPSELRTRLTPAKASITTTPSRGWFTTCGSAASVAKALMKTR